MPTDSDNLRVLAEFAADAFHFGLLAPRQVIAWADSLIAAGPATPPPWLIDLALADPVDRLALLAALAAVPGDRRPAASAALLEGLVWREWSRGTLTIGRVRGVGWQLHQRGAGHSAPAHWGVVIECEGEFLDDGQISEATMRRLIDRQLARFAPEADRLPPWA